MSDLIERARIFATQAHQRIDQRRKYSKQPYHVHLDAVSKLIATVSDDAQMIAAAWLHDTVEDTPATRGDIELHFGLSVASLVEELTDVSKPSDGNRAKRKAIDLAHSKQASARAKTVKLADLIDNCKDITEHDKKFARVFLLEADALLNVLDDGDEQLYQQACRVHAECMQKVGLTGEQQYEPEQLEQDAGVTAGFGDQHFKRLFMELFAARDIAEGLLSFDADNACKDVRNALDQQQREVASIRAKGAIQGYVRMRDLEDGKCVDCYRQFKVDQVVPGDASFVDVIHVLTRRDYCFVMVLGSVAGVICRDDVNKPMVRMWLFGIVTMIEMALVQLIQEEYPGLSWQENISKGRLEKAKEIQLERQRRNQHCALIDCLQLSDKGQIVISNAGLLDRLGFSSKKSAQRGIKELESLRNHLAHAQDIVMHDWAQIARMTKNMEEIVRNS